MNVMRVILSLVVLCSFAVAQDPKKPEQEQKAQQEDPKSPLQLPAQFQQQVINHLQQAGEQGGKAKDNLTAQVVPEGALRSIAPTPPSSAVTHYVYCVPTGTHIQYLAASGELTKGPKFTVTVQGNNGPEEVKDAVVKMAKKPYLYDDSTASHWGLGGTSVSRTKSYAVKMDVSSKTKALGNKIEGCIPQPVNQVTLVTMCYDSVTYWPARK